MAHEIRAGSFLMPIGAKLQDGKVNVYWCCTFAGVSVMSNLPQAQLPSAHVLLRWKHRTTQYIMLVAYEYGMCVCQQVVPEVLAAYRKQLEASLL